MGKNEDMKLAMVTSITEVLKIRKGKKDVNHEEMMRELEGVIRKVRDKDSRLMMIVAASKTLDVLNRNPKMSDKEVMKKMVQDFDAMIQQSAE